MDLLQWSLALSWSHPIRWESLCIWTTLWKMGWMGTCVPKNKNKTAWGTIVKQNNFYKSYKGSKPAALMSAVAYLYYLFPSPTTLHSASPSWNYLHVPKMTHFAPVPALAQAPPLLCCHLSRCCVSLLAAWTPVLVIYLSVHLSRWLTPPGSRSTVCSFTSNCYPHKSPATLLFWNT